MINSFNLSLAYLCAGAAFYLFIHTNKKLALRASKLVLDRVAPRANSQKAIKSDSKEDSFDKEAAYSTAFIVLCWPICLSVILYGLELYVSKVKSLKAKRRIIRKFPVFRKYL